MERLQNCKLYYFNATGLAEPIRYLLAYGGITFQDIRIDYEDWLNHFKKIMPIEQMPVLEINDLKYHQSKSICRFIAKLLGLGGNCEDEAYEIDALVDSIDDMRTDIGRFYLEENPAFKAVLEERMTKKILLSLNDFEARVPRENSYFFAEKITWADIYYAGICEIMTNILKYDINKDHPKLNQLVRNVRNIENIKSYLNKRPVCFI